MAVVPAVAWQWGEPYVDILNEVIFAFEAAHPGPALPEVCKTLLRQFTGENHVPHELLLLVCCRLVFGMFMRASYGRIPLPAYK
jgi:hypothetical protein